MPHGVLGADFARRSLVGVAMSRGLRTFYNGEEFISIQAAAKILGVSKSTMFRMEAKGVLPRPAEIPRGRRYQRWYKPSDVEAAKEILAGGGFVRSKVQQVQSGEPTQRRSWREFAPGRRSPRAQVEDDGEDVEGWLSPAELRDGLVPEAPRAVEAVCCPRCGAEVTFLVGSVPGAKASFNTVAECQKCGVVDLDVPEPVPGTCVRCGAEPVWEMRDGEQGFVPICAEHDKTQVHPDRQKLEEQRQQGSRYASFPPLLPLERPGRRRGLREGDIVGAVRQAKPPPRTGLGMLPPYERR
jgi:predicted DNA-binding transcriptional regulator AlpA